MTQIDDRILEYLAEEEWATPALVVREARLDVSAGFVRDRCRMLAFAGLVYEFHSDSFELTTWGRRYLDGKLDAQYQPTPTLDRVRKH